MVQEDLRGREARRVAAAIALGDQHRPRILEIRLEGPARRPAEEADPLLAALAHDPDLAPREVEGAQLGGGELADPQPGGIRRLDECSIPQPEGGP